MAILLVPCVPAGVASWVQRNTLDGVDYLLTFRWSQRDGHWFLDLRTQDQVDVVLGRKLTPGWPLLRGVQPGVRPPGELVLVDSADPTNSGATRARYAVPSNPGVGEEPAFDTLGVRWQLVYYPAAELP